MVAGVEHLFAVTMRNVSMLVAKMNICLLAFLISSVDSKPVAQSSFSNCAIKFLIRNDFMVIENRPMAICR